MRKLVFAVSALMSVGSLFADRVISDFNDGWEFAREDGKYSAVEIPHDWAIEGPFDLKLPAGSGCLPWKGVGYYRKTFVLDKLPVGRRTLLDFDGIMCDGLVFINGTPVGHEPYGYLGLKVNLTPYLEVGTNTVLVKADTTKLASRWYPGAGLYRRVRKVETDEVFVDEDELVLTTPDVSSDKATLKVVGSVENHGDYSGKSEVSIEVTDPSGKVVAGSIQDVITKPYEHGRFQAELTVAKPKLWTMTPNAALYGVKVSVKAGKSSDAVSQRVGFRTFRFDAENGFILNGKRVQLQGIDLHADLGILGLAFNRSAMRRQLQVMREMGANALRTSHNPPSPEVLELCDEMGFFVWNECFDKWNATSGRKDENLEQYMTEHLRKFVRRDRNHACVFLWSIGNEIPSGPGFAPGQEVWGMKASVGTTRYKCSLFRRAVLDEDPTRPVGIGCCFPEAVEHGDYEELDITGWNYREMYKDAKKKYPNKPVIYSESASAYSVFGYYSDNIATQKADYAWSDLMIDSYDRNSAFWSDIPDVEFERMETDRYVAGEFVWTGIDYMGEPAPYDGRGARSSYFGICDLLAFPKDRYYLYRSHWNKDAFTLHIVPHHWNFEGRKSLPVYVYATAHEVELFVNGVSQGRRRLDPTGSFRKSYYGCLKRYRFIWDDVKYAAGTVKAVAYDTNGKVLGEQTISTAGAAAAVVLKPESKKLPADRNEFVFVEVTLADAKGVPVPKDNRKIAFSVEGPCQIVSVGNGDPTGLESFKKTDSHSLHMGRAGVIMRRTGPGVAKLRASAPDLAAAEITFE